MVTKGDKILIFFILILAFLIFAGFNLYGFTGDKMYAIVEQNGKIVEKIALGKNSPKLMIKVPTVSGDNIIEIDGDRVRMLFSHCDDQDCVRQGYIDKQGQMIVCLPQRIVIKIESEKSKNEVDAVSY